MIKDDFEERCEKGIEELRRLKKDNSSFLEETRLGGKIEGVQLALSYYREEKILNEKSNI
jgi:hypothetical protein